MRASNEENRAIAEKARDLLNPYNDRLNDLMEYQGKVTRKESKGKRHQGGGIKYYKARPPVCYGKEARHDSTALSNDMVEILTALLNDSYITKDEYKEILHNYIE